MTGLPLPPPPPLPDEHDTRAPDGVSRWGAIVRWVHALTSARPAARLVAGTGTDLRARMREIRASPWRLITPRTVPAIVDGYERAEPDGVTWCNSVGLTCDDGAGARLVQSEVGDLLWRGYSQYGIAVGLATINEARHRYASISDGVFWTVTSDPRTKHKGYFGRQGGRWAASLENPTARALAAFRAAADMHARSEDFTRGARRWVDGYTQDRLYRKKRVRFDALGIVEKWGREGWLWVGPIYDADGATPMIDPYRLMLFKFVGRGGVDIWPASQAVKDGRARWGTR